jgi:hypothetical protein
VSGVAALEEVLRRLGDLRLKFERDANDTLRTIRARAAPRVGELEPSESGEDFEAILARVDGAHRSGSFSGVSMKDLRRVVRAVHQPAVSFALLGALGGTFRSLVPNLARAVLARWSSLAEAERLEPALALLRASELGATVVGRAGLSRRLDVGLPAELAREFDLAHGGDLTALVAHLEGRGLKIAWEISTECVARWLEHKERGPESWARTWETLHDRAELAPLLSYTRRGERFDELAPTAARVRVLAALARALTRGRLPKDLGTDVMEAWLKAHQDLRTSSSLVWGALKRAYPEVHQALVELLSTEDLDLFFGVLSGTDKRRLEFWRDYVPKAERTECYLPASAIHDVERAVREGRVPRTLLARCKPLRGSSGSAVFCFYFPRLVAVEFSQTGNALYYYQRAVFERHVLPGAREVADFKLKRGAEGSQNHTAGWESVAQGNLRRFGIEP